MEKNRYGQYLLSLMNADDTEDNDYYKV